MEDVSESLSPRTVNGEQAHNTSSNGHVTVRNGENGRHSKKKKEKEKPVKIQQRGKGVAELEKNRLAELEKNKGVVISSPVITPLPAQELYNRSDAAPLQPPFVTHTRTPYHLSYEERFKLAKDYPYHNVGYQSDAQLNGAWHGNGIHCPNVFFATEGNGNNHMTYEERSSTTTRLGHKNNTSDGLNLPRTIPVQLGNQHSYFQSPSAANHVDGMNSSAVLSFQTEPPSNQSLYGIQRSLQLDEAEKIVGTKRPYLSSMQDSPDRTEICESYPFTSHSLGRSTSTGAQGLFGVNGYQTLRDGLPCSMSMPNLQLRMETKTGCATPDLMLGPPSTTPSLPSSIFKQALSYAPSHQPENYHLAELLKNSTPSYQVQAQGSNSRGSHVYTVHNNQQGPYPTFQEASNNLQNGQPTNLFNHDNGETEDNLDLSLKL